MSSNVLPSAPEYGDAETQTTLYPVLPTPNVENFRLTDLFQKNIKRSGK